MNSIKRLLPSFATGIRDGAQAQIQTSSIVQGTKISDRLNTNLILISGDVITVTLGNKIPADVRWIQVSKLKLGW
jgi:magnesium-transporting ATPase (P-type)